MASKTFHSVYNQIRSKILLSGPITVADYMKMALTIQKTSNGKDFSSSGGYYMEHDVFGQHGDFITSPEISQLFGEMMGVWGIDTWRRIGGPKNFNIVELGPGRGTLAKDILRVFHQFNDERNIMKLHLVEISPYLAKVQFETLCGPIGTSSSICHDDTFGNKGHLMEIDPMRKTEINSHFYQGVTNDTHKTPVFWHRYLSSVPKGFNLYIAHEFFDALPVHKLQRIDNAWREVLVDIVPEEESISVGVTADGDNITSACVHQEKRDLTLEKFRFVISRHETPVIQILKSYYASLLNDTNRSQFEFSLDGAQICEELTQRLEEDGGVVLIVDYGHEGTKGDTFRGFRRHKLHDPLESPGLVDLTADVDFSILGKIAQKKAVVCGPITQAEFLRRVGIEVRLANLHSRCKTEDERQQLVSGYKMLMDDMGNRFKCLALLPKVLEEFRPKLKITAFDN